MIRCTNFDWLELYCVETDGYPARTPDYYCSVYGDANVSIRPYGTPMYREMFSICYAGKAMVEVRRNPLSKESEGGLFPDNACHIRLANRVCYYPDPVGFLYQFMRRHHLEYISTKRVDICLDFNRFDTGQDPARFLRSYFANKYAKINQCAFQNHGKDTWQSKEHNSAKWGSTSTGLTTKLYNKTMELNRQGHDKPYIRAAWKECGLSLDEDVWRVEFSIMPKFRNLIKSETGQVLPCDIMTFRTRSMLTELFFMLADRYFQFRYVEMDESGKLKRKDRCKEKLLFRISKEDRGWKPEVEPTERRSMDKTLLRIVDRLCDLADEQPRIEKFNHIMYTAQYIIDNYDCDDFIKHWATGIMDARRTERYSNASDLFFDQ